MAKPKETKVGLKRELTAMTNDRNEQEKRADGNHEAYYAIKKKLDKLNEEIDALTKKFHAMQLENAELHGYVNRVEVQDDHNWHEMAGAKTNPDENIIPPLRQRIRGDGKHTQNDIFNSPGMGRPARSRFAG